MQGDVGDDFTSGGGLEGVRVPVWIGIGDIAGGGVLITLVVVVVADRDVVAIGNRLELATRAGSDVGIHRIIAVGGGAGGTGLGLGGAAEGVGEGGGGDTGGVLGGGQAMGLGYAAGDEVGIVSVAHVGDGAAGDGLDTAVEVAGGGLS